MPESKQDRREFYKHTYRELQEKWRPIWRDMNLYATGDDPNAPKFYCLDFFPYPSGSGLSVGHLRNYVPTDVISRLKRMQGYNVLHPMGWDAFGFPAENYAIIQGKHPKETTEENVANYKRQMALAETNYDWSKEINSTDPAYYKWTQWFFGLLFKRGLAYQSEGLQWWCPECKSVLANEQVENGCCWRHSDIPVTKKALKQWFFRITDYAEALLDDLDTVDWPEHIKTMQRNWIGKSTGCEALFKARNPETGETFDFPIFTTRIDTVFGVTYMVVAPEHPLVDKLTTKEHKGAVKAYVEASMRKSEIDRLAVDKEKTGVATGAIAINPANGEEVPVWVADYVLHSYGTGIVMAVPAHDTRDFAFATKYRLPIRQVISPTGKEQELGDAYVDPGVMINSARFIGMESTEALEKITDWLDERKMGERKINYRFRDWLISRQRYWGAPIPIIHCEKCGPQLVPDEDLPVRLPELPIEQIRPHDTGDSPLAHDANWVQATCPACQGEARRETDTMDGFVCSSWYFLRFPNPTIEDAAFAREDADSWLPVDIYVGGAEHAVMHLLYARFWTKVMHDAGIVSFREPFSTLKNQGMMLGADGQKMSKSKGNVVTPDTVEAQYGTDCLRTFILFLGSFESEVPWSDTAISGVFRFLEKVWDLAQEHPGRGKAEADPGAVTTKELRRWVHRTIKKVTEDVESFSFNTAISALMELRNAMGDMVRKDASIAETALWGEAIEALLVLLAPIAPFISEELWERTGRREITDSIHLHSWPQWDATALVVDEISYPVQVNGKIRDTVIVAAELSDDAIREKVMASPKVHKYVEGKTVKKFIVVKGRLVSIAVK